MNDASATAATGWRQLRQAWAARNARERQGLLLAAAVLLAFLLWTVGLAPALRTLRQAPARIAALDAELQAMQQSAAEAQELRATPPLPAAQAPGALAAAAARLGERARLMTQGERSVLTLDAVPGDRLVAWLAEVRVSARARVVESQLTRTAQGSYTGTVVLVLGSGR